MAVRETLLLDLSQALSQIDELERELDGLFTPIVVPVDIETDAALSELRADIRAVDNDDINIDVDTGELSQAEREIAELQDELADAVDEAEDFGDEMRRASREAEDLGSRGRRAFGGLASTLGTLAVAAAGFVGLRELTQFFGASIEAASDLEESTSKAQVVFGEFFDDIQDFAGTAPQALGLANAAALEFTGTFGNLFTALGLSQEAAAQLAPEIVQLGADLASFNNIEVTDALDKLRAGLVGEAEPLRALGVNLDAATVEAKALELGLGGVSGEIDNAAKVQARYALILDQTATAQGDFARTSDGIANRQRTLAAEFENLRAAVGEALLPAFEQLLDIAPALITAIEQGLVPAIASLGTALGEADTEGFTRAIAGLPSAVGTVFGNIGDAAGFLGNTFQGLGDLVRFDLVSAFDQFQQAGENISDISIRNTINSSVQDLITTLQAGADPLAAFEAVLADLGDANLPTSELGALAGRLAAIAQIGEDDAAGLFDLVDIIEDLGPAVGFSAEEIQILVTELLNLARGGLDPADAALRNFIGTAGGPAVDGLEAVGSAVQEVQDIVANTPASAAILEGFLDGIDLGGEALESELAAITGQFNALPDEMSAVKEALRTEENEIVTDFGEFFENLESELAARASFRQNIDLLRDLGFDNLADEFAQIGLDSASALADGLANPEQLAQAEAALDQFSQEAQAAYAQNIADAVASGTSSIAELIAAIQSVNGLTSEAQIRILFSAINSAGDLALARAAVTGSAPGTIVGGAAPSGGGGGPNIQIVNNGILPTDTDTARTAQQVSAIIGNAR